VHLYDLAWEPCNRVYQWFSEGSVCVFVWVPQNDAVKAHATYGPTSRTMAFTPERRSAYSWRLISALYRMIFRWFPSTRMKTRLDPHAVDVWAQSLLSHAPADMTRRWRYDKECWLLLRLQSFSGAYPEFRQSVRNIVQMKWAAGSDVYIPISHYVTVESATTGTSNGASMHYVPIHFACSST